MILETLGETRRLARCVEAAYKGARRVGQRVRLPNARRGKSCDVSQAVAEHQVRRSRALRGAGRQMVGPRRPDGAAASREPDPDRLGARPDRAAFQARDGGRRVARRNRPPRCRLRGRTVRRAVGAAWRQCGRRRSGPRRDSSRPPSCRGDGRQARLSHGCGRGPGGGAAAFRCRHRDGGDRARRRSETLRRHRRVAGQARRASDRLDPQPHLEKLRPRDRRGRICLALARARNAPLGAIRNPARTHRLRPRRGPKAPEPARHGLRPVQARLAPLVRYGRELPVRRDEAGGLNLSSIAFSRDQYLETRVQ